MEQRSGCVESRVPRRLVIARAERSRRPTRESQPTYLGEAIKRRGGGVEVSLGDMDKDELLTLYRDPSFPGSLAGVNTFVRGLRRRGKHVASARLKKYLRDDDLYQLHKPSRRRFPRRSTIVQGVDHLWQADLSDVSSIKRHNDDYRFLLFVIDAFSKYAWVRPLKNKTADTLTRVVKDILQTSGRRPLHLMSDKGSEFSNRPFKAMLKTFDIRFYTSQNEETKAAIVERLQRTFKNKMFKYFTDRSTLRYADVLQDLMRSYNETHHTTIGMAPADVDWRVDDDVRRRLASRLKKKKRKVARHSKVDLRVGDSARIAIARATFRKGYLPTWTEEIFTVAEKNDTHPVTYRLKDYGGELLEGTFYVEELQKVPPEKDRVYRIEKVLRRRTRRGKREMLVKWLGYPEHFNSWIDEGDLV